MSHAYSYELKQNSFDSHQTSPGIMLTVLRWNNRDTKNYSGDPFAIRTPLVIMSDIMSINVANAKTNVTPALQVLLKGGDINYTTAIAPGDFVYVNMVNEEKDVYSKDPNSLYSRAVSLKPINNFKDGFKGLYKVQGVRRQLSVDPASGVKNYQFLLVAYGFTEFNNIIYYDPQVYQQLTGNFRLFMLQIQEYWDNLIGRRFSIQDLMKVLIKVLIGQGTKKLDPKLPPPANRFFGVPIGVGKLLGVNAAYACELYNYLFGIWKKSTTNTATPQEGFNPGFIEDDGVGFYKTANKLEGQRLLAADYWNCIKVWSILQSYLNPTINEMYSTYRVNTKGSVMPTLVVRQKPFTTLHYKGKGVVSRHLEMPRWKLNPNLLLNMDLGKDENARTNFVQVKTRSLSMVDGRNNAIQTGQGNWLSDEKDISRNGLRPNIQTANYDFPPESGDVEIKNKKWAGLVADWLFEGHLRESGTFLTMGIQEPISVGDNLEFNGVVYHIESVVHFLTIDNNGKKSFRTQLTVSWGMDDRSTSSKPFYPEMVHTSSDKNRQEDWDNERILPGSSDLEDVSGRANGEKTTETPEKSFSPIQTERTKPTGPVDGTEPNPSDKR